MKFTLAVSFTLFAVTIAAPAPAPEPVDNNKLEARATCHDTCPGVCDMYGWGSGTCAGCYMNCKRDLAARDEPATLQARGNCHDVCPDVCNMYGWGSGTCAGCYMNCKREADDASMEKREIDARATCHDTCPGVCDMFGWGSGTCSGCYMNCKREALEDLPVEKREAADAETKIESRATCHDTCPGVCDMFGWGSGTCAGCYMNCKREVAEDAPVEKRNGGEEAPEIEARESKCKTFCPSLCQQFGYGSGVCSGCYMNCH